MTRVIKGWIENFIQRWQARCPHDPKYVRADILEGDVNGKAVRWCYRCGAYSTAFYTSGLSGTIHSEWRSPKSAWATRTGL